MVDSVRMKEKTRPRLHPRTRRTAIWRRRSFMLLYMASMMPIPEESMTAAARATKM